MVFSENEKLCLAPNLSIPSEKLLLSFQKIIKLTLLDQRLLSYIVAKKLQVTRAKSSTLKNANEVSFEQA